MSQIPQINEIVKQNQLSERPFGNFLYNRLEIKQMVYTIETNNHRNRDINVALLLLIQKNIYKYQISFVIMVGKI